MEKSSWITLAVILAVIALAYFLINKQTPETPEDVAKCIGKNSIIYVQLGCRACKIQEDIFGENYKHLNVIDCFYERERCTEIQFTPTWIIKDKKYEGVKTIETLKELTGC